MKKEEQLAEKLETQGRFVPHGLLIGTETNGGNIGCTQFYSAYRRATAFPLSTWKVYETITLK